MFLPLGHNDPPSLPPPALRLFQEDVLHREAGLPCLTSCRNGLKYQKSISGPPEVQRQEVCQLWWPCDNVGLNGAHNCLQLRMAAYLARQFAVDGVVATCCFLRPFGRVHGERNSAMPRMVIVRAGTQQALLTGQCYALSSLRAPGRLIPGGTSENPGLGHCRCCSHWWQVELQDHCSTLEAVATWFLFALDKAKSKPHTLCTSMITHS